ncbi:MAG: amino acid permease [Candidatus Heimdallarchaeota archaeon]|nr:amino acid permease [Candidatus Heimdallarchaeota archaeon]
MPEDNNSPNNNGDVELSKELGLKEALGIAIGALIGGGVFSVLGLVIYDSGPAAFLAFLLAGVVSTFTAYSYVHLALKYPKAGGAFIYVQEAFKKKWLSGSLGILLWFGYSFSVSLYAMTFGRYLGEVWPLFGECFWPFFGVSVSAFIFQILSVLIFIGLNMIGVKESSRAQNVLVLTKVIILVLYIVVGTFAVESSNFVPFLPNGVFPLIASSVLIFVSMEGFEILSNSVEEMKNPERDLKLGMYISIIVVLILYVSVAVITVGVLGHDDSLQDIGEVILTHSASRFLGVTGAGIMAVAAIISAASAINATLLGSSRLSYMLSHEGIIPKAIAKISPKTRVPMRAIALSGLLSIIIVILFKLEFVAMAASIIFMVIFAAVNISAIRLLESKKKIPSLIGVILIVIYWGIWISNFIING